MDSLRQIQKQSKSKVEIIPFGRALGLIDAFISQESQNRVYFIWNPNWDVDELITAKKVQSQMQFNPYHPEYFVLANNLRTYLFRNDQGPLRELQIQLWQNNAFFNTNHILEQIFESIKNKRRSLSRVDIFFTRFSLLFRHINQAYQKIIKEYIRNASSEILQKELHALNSLGWDLQSPIDLHEESMIANLGQQASYILMNKIFSYEVLRVQLPELMQNELPSLLKPHDSSRIITLSEHLNDCFRIMVEKFEFAPIFQPDPFFANLSFSPSLESAAQNFIAELHEFNLANLNDDFIGDIYQKLLTPEKKKELGQIYTPNEIAEMMSRLAIRDQNAMILDPACGCGTFLRTNYDQLERLAGDSGTIESRHRKIISQLWGVEINLFPAQIAMLTLGFRKPTHRTENVGVLLQDFLDLGPMEKYIVKTKNLQTGQIISREMPHKFDVVIGNPPYIKQERIPNKAIMMKKLPQYAAYRLVMDKSHNKLINNPPKVKLELTGKTDYYGFFLWYSTFFLKETGILCFIIPNKWMDVAYGEEIKAFIHQNYKILAIIGFDRNTFENAQVSTVVLLLQKESCSQSRKDNIVRVLSVNAKITQDYLNALVYNPLSSTQIHQIHQEKYLFINSDPSVQCTYIHQESLKADEKWSFKYLFQSELTRRLQGCDMIYLHNSTLTSVVGGIKTGANDFFFPSEDAIKKYNIEKQFLLPGIKTGRSIPETTIINENAEYFLALNSENDAQQNPGVKKFIEDGESIHQYLLRPSMCWKPWYVIPAPKRDQPDILFLRHIDSDFRARWNRVGCIVADGVRGIKVFNANHLLFYLGICNSTFFYWQAHILGRWEGQGDLQLLVYELKKFLIPDILKLSVDKIQAVENAMQKILDREQQIISTSTFKNAKHQTQLQLLRLSVLDREELDRAVLACINLSDSYELLVRETTFLETFRLTKKL